jgi:TolB protein
MKHSCRERKPQIISILLLSIIVISACQLKQFFVPVLTPTPTRTITVTATSTITPAPTATGGGLIAFTNPVNFNLCFIHADGSNRKCLDIKGDQHDWSPDGKRLVFHSLRDENFGLYVVNADGTNINRLTYSSEREFDRDPTWSPDGKQIVFTTIDSFIYVINADGTNATRMTGIFCNFPTWSPDGKRIAVSGRNAPFIQTSSSCNSSGIYLMDIDGSNKTLLVAEPAEEFAWSPDGKRIAFVSKRDAPPGADSFYYDIYCINANGSNLIRLTQNGQGGYDLTWSPDGERIAFSNYNGDENKWLIYIMNADGSNVTTLTEGMHPAWQP